MANSTPYPVTIKGFSLNATEAGLGRYLKTYLILELEAVTRNSWKSPNSVDLTSAYKTTVGSGEME